MKKIHLIVALLMISCHWQLFGQITTSNPYVESAYQSVYSELSIIGVYIVDEENGYTIIFLEGITSRNITDQWISLSSKTTITAKNTNISLKILDWGLYGGEFESLKFNERYSLKADRKYTFYMIFPKVPAGIERITIRENIGSDQFYWIGIHINNPNYSSGMNTPPSTGRYTSPSSGMHTPPSTGSPSTNRQQDADMDFSGSSSGFAISSSGLIVTCYHVVKQARRIRIRGINGALNRAYNAVVLSFDRQNDLAILMIDDDRFTVINRIPYTLSDRIADVGDDVFVLGYPLPALMGNEIKLTNGLISSNSGFRGDNTSYQISAPVQPGNSGCPLFDGNGNIIGVVNARLFNIENAAYAVKMPYLKTLLSSLQNPPFLPKTNILSGKSLSEQVKEIRNFVYIVEVDN